jgi:hypothetical protein
LQQPQLSGLPLVPTEDHPAQSRGARSRFHVSQRPLGIGLQIQVLNASTSLEIDAAFATLVRERPDALFVATDALFTSRRVQLANLASRHCVLDPKRSEETTRYAL